MIEAFDKRERLIELLFILAVAFLSHIIFAVYAFTAKGAIYMQHIDYTMSFINGIVLSLTSLALLYYTLHR
ncbi:MAG TPA: hypothetical protein VHR47_08810, partial [Bacillota bacterium]|nr:hypothetical protein [Bacillota bacterium]